MKIISSTILCLLVAFITKAQNTINAQAQLNNATIYTNGVELSHQAKVYVPGGSHELIIENVANVINENTIQVGANANITIMSVSFSRDYLLDKTKHPSYIKIEDSLKIARRHLNELNNDKKTEEDLLKLMDANNKIGGNETGMSVAELTKLAEYQKKKLTEIRMNILKLNEQIDDQNKQIAKLQQQLNEIGGTANSTGGQIKVQLMAKNSAQTEFKIKYISPNAGWEPFYDLRSKGVGEQLEIVYKANVTQYTGIDWKAIPLTLSTGAPLQSNNAPELQTWFLKYRNEALLKTQYKSRLAGDVPSSKQKVYVNDPETSEDMDGVELEVFGNSNGSLATYITTEEQQLNAVFNVNIPYDIASNAKPHSVTLQEFKHPVSYVYYTVPKLDADVYLVAEMSGYEKLNLLPGEANIVFEDMYVGKTFISPGIVDDTLKLSMGKDKKVITERKTIIEKSGAKLVGSNQRHTFTYDLIIRNGKKESITVLLKDQYPIATNTNMEVEVLESSNATANKETGELSWKITIPANASETRRISYSVKFPKGQVIGNLR